MKIRVTIKLQYNGKRKPSEKELRVIEDTIANEISNGTLDFDIGTRRLLGSVTMARNTRSD